MASSGGRDFVFAIDRGGTFTDVFAEVPDAEGGHVYRALKLLSEDPENYPDAPREGIRRILEAETGIPHPRDAPLDTARISSIRMGTTVATNALLERKGERNALVVTAGFRDLLLIGNQSRPQIFDLRIQRPDLLYEMVVEVDEEVVLPLGSTASKRNGTAEQILQRGDERGEGEIVTGITGEKLQVRKPLKAELLRPQLQAGSCRWGWLQKQTCSAEEAAGLGVVFVRPVGGAVEGRLAEG